MKNDMFTIIRKELTRFFGDKRLVFTTVLLPGIMIYIVYTFMGTAMAKKFSTDDSYVAKAYVQNIPAEFEQSFGALSAEWSRVDSAGAEEAKDRIKEKEADVLVVFPENFLSAIASYGITTGQEAPKVELYYNSTESESTKIYNVIRAMLENYEASVTNLFDVNPGEEGYDLADEKDVTGQIFSMMLPLLLMTFMFSGCMSVAPEAIAGEKERGTIATLLVTPLRRSSLALGKIISLSCIALLSGMSSFIGTMLSLPNLAAGQMEGMDASVYGISDYLLLLGIILTTVLVLIAVISLISACAKSVKEASSASSPLMVISMVVSLLPMLVQSKEKNPLTFVIPLYNSVQCMHGIFAFRYEPVQMVLTFASNLIFAGGLAFALTKLFDNEKVMFSK